MVLFFCKFKVDIFEVLVGNVDFICYVFIGNFIIFGFVDVVLYYDGQMVFYFNLFFMQFKMVGGGDFV